VDATIYFLCAEALTNAVRHAPGSTVRVSLGRTATVVTVTIADDGPGGAGVRGGTGLRGLRDRVEALGGRLAIDSPVGEGTHLVATIPIIPEAPHS
jgi:signal transduction histidine kinase